MSAGVPPADDLGPWGRVPCVERGGLRALLAAPVPDNTQETRDAR